MLEIFDLSKSFTLGDKKSKSSVYPLKSVSLSIDNGKKIGLVGKSGEGKSTLANILCGIEKTDGGSVLIDGLSLFDGKNKYDKKAGVKVQLIPQKPLLALDPSQRIGSAVKETLVFSKAAKRGKDAQEKALRLFDVVGLERTLFSRLPVHLSGGQAQRAVIARALAANPRILVCDESTSMLDAATQKNVVELLDGLVKERGVSLLFISHDVALVKNFCDETYLLEDGKLRLLENEIEQQGNDEYSKG